MATPIGPCRNLEWASTDQGLSGAAIGRAETFQKALAWLTAQDQRDGRSLGRLSCLESAAWSGHTLADTGKSKVAPSIKTCKDLSKSFGGNRGPGPRSNHDYVTGSIQVTRTVGPRMKSARGDGAA